MLRKEDCLRAIKTFRAKQGLDASDENIIATIHLMNAHGLDIAAALDQSSRAADDHGIDAWFYDDEKQELYIYQSKLSEGKGLALRGFGDLDRARQWIEPIVIEGVVETVPSDNNCLFTLYTFLAGIRAALKRIRFTLLCLFDENELEDSPEHTAFEKTVVGSKLNEHIRKNGSGRLNVGIAQYNLEKGVPARIKTYPIPVIPSARLSLRKSARLDLAYIGLYDLVQLYRQRGDVLFDKNVRLSLIGSKDARQRLVHPMQETLQSITTGELSPNIFPFYHVGVTIAAPSAAPEDSENVLSLESPSIINGCQTIAIANEYLKRLERNKADSARMETFKQIKVIAKVVVGTSNEELKEITNSNNRQNPIENWQLFSNEPLHIDIESELKEIGIFYERQKGKFDAVMKIADNAQHYYATNGTYIKVVDLAQLIALSRKNLQWAAKYSEIFLNKVNHDKIFDRTISRYTRDMVFMSNLFKAMKRGLNNYLDTPAYADGRAWEIFKKQIVRMHVFYITLLHYYQSDKCRDIRSDFSRKLNKIAAPSLTAEVEGFYRHSISKIRNWYMTESKNLTQDVSNRKLDSFFDRLAIDLGVETVEGAMPFSPSSIDWDEVMVSSV